MLLEPCYVCSGWWEGMPFRRLVWPWQPRPATAPPCPCACSAPACLLARHQVPRSPPSALPCRACLPSLPPQPVPSLCAASHRHACHQGEPAASCGRLPPCHGPAAPGVARAPSLPITSGHSLHIATLPAVSLYPCLQVHHVAPALACSASARRGNLLPLTTGLIFSWCSCGRRPSSATS